MTLLPKRLRVPVEAGELIATNAAQEGIEFVILLLAMLTGPGRVDVQVEGQAAYRGQAVPVHRAGFVGGRQVMTYSVLLRPLDEDYPGPPDGPDPNGPRPTNPPAMALAA